MARMLAAIPDERVEQRRRLGIDGRDEMWEGFLHVAPPPAGDHQRIATRLTAALLAVADIAGFETRHQPGIFDPAQFDRDHRVPDIAVFRAEQLGPRVSMAGAILAIDGALAR